MDLNVRYAQAQATLDAVDQAHVLRFYDQLDPAGRQRLLDQIEGIDWPEVARLIQSHVLHQPDVALPPNLAPAPYYPRTATAELKDTYARARARGQDLLRAGQVAVFTVAGGQGTRLGWDAPKGTFPATPIRGASLFQVFAEQILKAQQKYGVTLPWYIMTSPANDAATRAFFDEHGHFGLSADQIMLFPQAMMPALDMHTGRVLLADRDALALSPNGHGGSLKALAARGALADMRRRGIEHISYVQVDNPSVHVIDPLFLGLHDLDQAAMSSKMLPKTGPKEKLGNFCMVDGRITVIEYSDLPDELAEQRTPQGELRFRAGSIAIHAIRVDFVESLNQGGSFNLPFHRALKKVPYVDQAGTAVSPDQPNAVKLETFVFDALPLGERSIVLETDRVEEFAPIKNADAPADASSPAVDSPSTSKALQSLRAARWLEQAGVTVAQPDAVVLEIQPLTAITAEDLKAVDLPDSIAPGSRLLL